MLTHVATSFSIGGTERQLATVVSGLAARHRRMQQRVLLSGTAGGALVPGRLIANSRIRLEPLRGLDAEPPPGDAHPAIEALPPLTKRAARLQRIDSYRRLFLASRPDAVMIWKPEVAAAIGAVLAGVPRVLMRQGSVPPTLRLHMREHQAVIAELAAEGFRWLSRCPNVCFVANSASVLAEMATMSNWPADRSFLLPNALDPVRFATVLRKPDARRRLGLPQSATIVGGCFRLAPEKRPLLWLETAERCLSTASGPPLHFVIAGDGPLRDALAEEIVSRGLADRVHLLGQVGDSIAAFHASLDLLLHTAAFEGLPNAVVEAQWAGTPVVAAKAGGVEEAFLAGQTGTLVETSTPGALAAAVQVAIRELPAYRNRRDVFTRFVASRFTVDACLEQIDKLLDISDQGHSKWR